MTTENKTTTETKENKKTVDQIFVDKWNKGDSKSSIILAVYDTGTTVSGVLKVFQRYGVPMIYNHIFNVVSKRDGKVRTEKGIAADRPQLQVK